MDFTISQLLVLVIVGLLAGALSGFVGVGGGIVIVPAMIYFLQMGQKDAQGVSLAVLLMPVGILGVMNYYREGHIHLSYSLIIALGFIAGSYFGSKYALKLPTHAVKFIFGVFLLFIAGQMIWKGGKEWFIH